MPEEALTQFESGTDLNQALRFHSRERRRSLAGVVEMSRTHRIFGDTVMEVASIATADVFPTRTSPITFQTAIRIGAGTSEGLVFEFGDGTTGCACWVQNGRIGFRAGGSVGSDGSAVVWIPGGTWETGFEMDLVLAVIPGSGRIRMWVNGTRRADGTATNGSFGVNGWASTDAGSFAAIFSGAVPANVPAASQVAPTNFDVIQPLSIYVGQVPRHFV